MVSLYKRSTWGFEIQLFHTTIDSGGEAGIQSVVIVEFIYYLKK